MEWASAIMGFMGTVIGGLLGVVASSKMTAFRLEKLEEKIKEHNSYGLEIPVLKQRVLSLESRMKEVEKKCNNL